MQTTPKSGFVFTYSRFFEIKDGNVNNHFDGMKPSLITILVLATALTLMAQTTTLVYFFPGTGSDARLFSKIKLSEGFQAVNISYPVPAKNASMASYSTILTAQIDTSKPFVLVGVSIGGMFCTELAEQLHPLKTIIISSAKCRSELPRHYRFQREIPLNKLFGPRAIKLLSPPAQYVVEPDSRRNRATFKAMLHDKDRKFLKRAVNMIINWERTSYDKNIIHIHGENDHTLPLKNISPSIIVKDGSHMMTLTRGEEISALLQKILTER